MIDICNGKEVQNMETIIRKYLKHGADMLKPFENVPNNSVYSFESNGVNLVKGVVNVGIYQRSYGK